MEVFLVLQQRDPCFFAGVHRFLIPDTGLNFTNVGTAHHQHTQSALTDTATNGQGQLIIQKHFVEGQIPSVVTAGDG